jgi:hypothetical protein
MPLFFSRERSGAGAHFVRGKGGEGDGESSQIIPSRGGKKTAEERSKRQRIHNLLIVISNFCIESQLFFCVRGNLDASVRERN